MSAEPKHQTSRAGVLLVLLAIGGSAVGVLGWHFLSNRGIGLDTSGFDMSAAPTRIERVPVPAPPPPAAQPQTSLKMVKADEGIRVLGPGESATKAAGGTKTADPKKDAAMSFKDEVVKNEGRVDAFVRRMQRKHPSLSQYGKDWIASPELRALRDQYWTDRDPVKFAYGLAKSNDFAKLLKKYAADPAIHDVLVTGIKEAPPNLTAPFGGFFQSDYIVKELVTRAIKILGLPTSLVATLFDEKGKVPDQNRVMSDIMNSDEMKKVMKNQPAPAVSLPDKDKEPEPTNGFQPLKARR